MNILLNQTFFIQNMIIYTGKFTSNRFQTEIIKILNTHKEYVFQSGQYLITTTKSVEIVDGEQILDVEVLIPVEYKVQVDKPYTFKDTFKLTNALYAKVEDITNLQDALIEVNNYILNNKMQPITSTYLVQSRQEDKNYVEIYIGLNPNIL